MEYTHPEGKIQTHFEKQLSPCNYTPQIEEIRAAISLIADQILDLYFDQLDREE